MRPRVNNHVSIVLFSGFALVIGLFGVSEQVRLAGAVTRSNEFWSNYLVEGIQAERFRDLPEMTQASDAVVVGRIRSIEPGRIFGQAGDYQVSYVSASLWVDDVLSGRAAKAGDKLTLELMAADPSVLPEPPRESTVFFLRNKGVEAARLGFPSSLQLAESAYFRLVRFEAFLRNFSGRVKVAGTAEYPWLVGLDDEPFDGVVRMIRSLGG